MQSAKNETKAQNETKAILAYMSPGEGAPPKMGVCF